MIRFLSAFTWLRWRLLLNAFRRRTRRDTMERLSRALSVLVPVVIGILLVPASLVLGLLAFFAGRLLGTGEVQTAPILVAVRVILLASLGTVLLVPLGKSSQGFTSGVCRFLLLPIPRRALHGVEILSGILDPWIAFLLPGLALLPVGLLVAGRRLAGIVAFGASLALVAVVACASAAAQFGLQWLVRDRRRAEVLSLVFILTVTTLGPLLAIVGDPGSRGREKQPRGAPVRVIHVNLDRDLPGWTLAIPTELYARTVREGTAGRWGPASLGLLAMVAEAGALYSISSRVHRKVLEAPPGRRAARASLFRIASPFRITGIFRLRRVSPRHSSEWCSEAFAGSSRSSSRDRSCWSSDGFSDGRSTR